MTGSRDIKYNNIIEKKGKIWTENNTKVSKFYECYNS